MRENARTYAERRLRMADYLGDYCRVIERLTGENPAPVAIQELPRLVKPAIRARNAPIPVKSVQRLVAADA
jgi:hypothetical protein